MGLDTVDQLRSFCKELSEDKPSPGGGTASAAAGAIAASLLIMVCGITARSKKHADDAPELNRLRATLETERDTLIELALKDARAYDEVVEVIKKQKNNPSYEKKAREAKENAFKQAAEVPSDTAVACLRLLRHSVKIAELGTHSASSDIAVAVLLADAGFRGAEKNVLINTEYIGDKRYVDRTAEKLRTWETEASTLASMALSLLEKP